MLCLVNICWLEIEIHPQRIERIKVKIYIISNAILLLYEISLSSKDVQILITNIVIKIKLAYFDSSHDIIMTFQKRFLFRDFN